MLAIDPGIDLVAAAVVDIPARRGATLADAARAFGGVSQHRTSARDSVLVRCREISAWVGGEIARLGIGVVVVEMPAKAGGYAERQRRQRTKGDPASRGLALLHCSIGAIAAGSPASVRLVEVSAGRYPAALRSKEDRHRAFNAALQRAGREPLAGNADTRDAAFLGAFYLCLSRD